MPGVCALDRNAPHTTQELGAVDVFKEYLIVETCPEETICCSQGLERRN